LNQIFLKIRPVFDSILLNMTPTMDHGPETNCGLSHAVLLVILRRYYTRNCERNSSWSWTQ